MPYPTLLASPGNLAIFAAILLASSRVSNFALMPARQRDLFASEELGAMSAFGTKRTFPLDFGVGGNSAAQRAIIFYSALLLKCLCLCGFREMSQWRTII